MSGFLDGQNIRVVTMTFWGHATSLTRMFCAFNLWK